MVEGKVVNDLDSFVAEASTVALVEIDSTRVGPVGPKLQDYEAQRTVGSAKVLSSVKGAAPGDVVAIGFGVESQDPSNEDGGVRFQGLEGYRASPGDRLVLSLHDSDGDGINEVTAPHAFFLVDAEGAFDPGLEAVRRECTDSVRSGLFHSTKATNAQGLLDELRVSADRQAEGNGAN